MTTRTRDGRALGVTVSSFCSVSLEPPLVLFCLGKETRNVEAYTESEFFAVNVLSEDQIDVSENFASPSDDKFRDIYFETGDNGSPVFPGCLATLECTLFEVYEGGDHLILVGRVDGLSTADDGAPLLRYRGRYAGIGAEVLSYTNGR